MSDMHTASYIHSAGGVKVKKLVKCFVKPVTIEVTDLELHTVTYIFISY